MVWLGWVSIILVRMIVPPLLPLIEKDFGISHAEAGILMSSYFIIYGLMQIPAGIFSDRLGRKRMMTIGIIGTSTITLALWRVDNYVFMVILRLLLGVFSGLWYAPGLALVTTSASMNDRGKALGLTLTANSVSNLLVFIIVGTFVDNNTSWRPFFLLCAILGFISSALFMIILREGKTVKVTSDVIAENRSPKLKEIASSRTVQSVLSYRLVTALSWGSLMTFMPTFLVLEKNLSIKDTSLTLLFQSFGMILSGLISGYLTDKIGYRRPILISTISISLMAALLPMIPAGIYLILLFFMWGILGDLANSPIQVFLSKAVPEEARGTFFGLQNGVGFIGSAIGPVILGFIADVMGFNTFFRAILMIYMFAFIISWTTIK
jgi:MFS family permease